jgi:hypothetical protein
MKPLQDIFDLPDRPHLPGRNARPEGGPVAAAAADARRAFDPAAWWSSAAYLYGFDLTAGGFFWEAHEVWEPAWARCLPNSRERAVLRGLIQCANAGLKSVLSRHGATARLLRLAETDLAEATGPTAVLGIHPARAAAALRRLRAALPGTDAAQELADCSSLRPNCIIMHTQLPHSDGRRGPTISGNT